MQQFEQLQVEIKKMVSEKRYLHCLGVMEEAVKLAHRWGADEEKARIAGLVHDVAKEFDLMQSYNLCDMLGVKLDEVTRFEHKLLHAPLGAMYAKKMMGIEDEEIYDAICYHTTAKPDMPLLTKIIYVADAIEPNRDPYEGLTRLRELAYRDLDAAIRMELDMTIQKLVDRGRMIHLDSIRAHNALVM